MKEVMVYVSLSIAALAIFLAVGLCSPQVETRVAVEAPSQTQIQPSYQDSCVTRVIEPDIDLVFVRQEPLSEECPYLCYYLFKIVNRTYAEGTKAYKVEAILQDKNTGYITLNEGHLQLITLHGLMSNLNPARFPELRREGYFVVQAKCPECLAAWEAQATFYLEYWDCKGSHKKAFNFNLSALL